uniref:Uncharacterized protein n=1 Tax=Ditylenchus dipsaci TaxID=166011 RepID=A0A915D2S4_9BILA
MQSARASCGYKRQSESYYNITTNKRRTGGKTSNSTVSLGRTIRKRRHATNVEPANPKTLHELQIPASFATIHNESCLNTMDGMERNEF